MTETHLIELDKLRQHEEADPEHLKELTKEIASDKILKYTIVVDEKTNVILDGEHRYNALKNLGCKRIPVIYVNYNSPNVEVQTWRNNYHLTKRDVIEAALTGKRFPPKTSRHMIRNSDVLSHISTIEKRVDIPLEVLRSELEFTPLKDIKTAMHVKLTDALSAYAKFLATGTVDTPLIVEKETNILLDGYDAYQALELLSAEKAPVFKVNLEKIEIKTLNPQLGNLKKETVMEAALKGPKLPPKSFRILAESVRINVPLKELMPPKEQNRKMVKVYNSPLELLYEGWPTPLVKLTSLSTDKRSVLGKLEFYNPFSNSVKDRIGWAMINEALKNGALKEVLYEATSTNTGIALTSIANTLGVKARLYIPEAIQKVSDIYLEVLGAEVVRLPVGLTVEAISQVDSEAKANQATHLNQFENDANFKVHLKHTAKEVDEQLGSLGLKPSCIIGGLGTSGHMSAISHYFKSKYKNSVKIVGVQPAPNEVIPGIRRIETGMKWFHWAKFDKIIDVKQSEAIEAAIKIARKEGLLIGLSAGAVVHAFQKIAKDKGVYVLVLPDSGYKYAEQFQKHFANQKPKNRGGLSNLTA
ncbi:MAG: pyridoxal-phosphate dependent enzyme [Candidatus Bathyarchaeota archaeon]|jgi:cysteine synthase/O-phosphoserine sulfhydrylase/cystathionine beta-synthase|nr:pyridoxal-phosphate dependent enzyme [Candidatus Bathyarchaeota archaeon A05DMB-3]MDH7607383.1 pyridoxal-phosphate dependent enzyme [Candidatus Bathyarchaeota archaeon]